jgi:hypothetical protein
MLSKVESNLADFSITNIKKWFDYAFYILSIVLALILATLVIDSIINLDIELFIEDVQEQGLYLVLKEYPRAFASAVLAWLIMASAIIGAFYRGHSRTIGVIISSKATLIVVLLVLPCFFMHSYLPATILQIIVSIMGVVKIKKEKLNVE